MTARVVPLHGADILLYPPESLNPDLWQRWRETRTLHEKRDASEALYYSVDEKLRIYERVLGGDDPDSAA